MAASRRIVLCLPAGMARTDPAPDETAKRNVELEFEWDGTAAGIVGFGEGGWSAVELAASSPELVDRLALVSTPPNDGTPPGPLAAKTLLLFGSLDDGMRQASWWKDRIGGRIEMVPREGPEILDRVWGRALSHLAPGTTR